MKSARVSLSKYSSDEVTKSVKRYSHNKFNLNLQAQTIWPNVYEKIVHVEVNTFLGVSPTDL